MPPTVAPVAGDVRVIQPGQAESHWQPMPANGHIAILFSPDKVRMEHPIGLGTQTVPPGGHVREHSHDRHEEVLFFIRGRGRAVIDGESVPLEPGTAIFLGRNRRHMFINEGDEDMHWMWLIVPNGLEDFFRAIGRPRTEGEAVPDAFPRPADVLEIERRTVFAPQPGDQRTP